MDTLRVAAVQMAHGASLSDNLVRTSVQAAEAAAEGARLVLLPEYFFSTFSGTPDTSASDAMQIRQALADISRTLGVALAGNVIEHVTGGYHNVGIVYEDGILKLEQAKVHPMPREAASGVHGGAGFSVATAAGHKLGMLVCSDILYPEASRLLSLQGADVLLNPVMSPWNEVDDGREARVAMYIARAYDAGAFVVKAAGYRKPTPGAVPPFGIAGRSLITAPWGVLARAKDDFVEEILLADLDFGRLAKFREHQGKFPARRPEVYRGLAE